MNTEPAKPSQIKQATIDARNALVIAELFVVKYESKLPEGLGSFYVGGFGAHYDVNLSYRDRDQRNKALSHLGEVFGRAGWEAKISGGYQFHGFDWTKEVDGVRVKIEGAQKIDQPQSFPVDPKQFPLQIEDAATA